MVKTAIIDKRVPLGKVYVDLTVDEVLEACKRYASDKAFDELCGVPTKSYQDTR